jgi:hypothetical protein
MGVLRLESYEEMRELPDVCMKCGAPAVLCKNKTFSWFPPWVWLLFFFCGLLPFAIVALVLTKRRTVSVPLCADHKNHWFWRQLVMVAGLLLLVVGFVAWIAAIDEPRGRNDSLTGLVCVGLFILLLIWLVGAIIAQTTSIRPKEITDKDITLLGVSDVFIQAYEDQWRVFPERLDELARERWNEGRRRRPAEESDQIRPDEEEGRRPPPDTYREGRP